MAAAQHPCGLHPIACPARRRGTPAAALALLRGPAQAISGACVVTQGDYRLQGQFRRCWRGFVDDVEFWVDPAAGVIHGRKASRIGHRDFGLNRARIERIRALLRA